MGPARNRSLWRWCGASRDPWAKFGCKLLDSRHRDDWATFWKSEFWCRQEVQDSSDALRPGGTSICSASLQWSFPWRDQRVRPRRPCSFVAPVSAFYTSASAALAHCLVISCRFSLHITAMWETTVTALWRRPQCWKSGNSRGNFHGNCWKHGLLDFQTCGKQDLPGSGRLAKRGVRHKNIVGHNPEVEDSWKHSWRSFTQRCHT